MANQVSTDVFEEVREAIKEPIAIHVAAVIIILLLSCVGNALVLTLYVNSKNNHRAVNIYVKTLAILDLAACCTVAPFTMCLDMYLNKFNESIQQHFMNAYVSLVRFFMFSNLGILSVLALDRACAIYKPFLYQTLKRCAPKMIKIIVSISISETLFGAFVSSSYIIKIYIGCNIAVGFFILLTAYPAIAYKLYRDQKVRVHVAHISHGSHDQMGRREMNMDEAFKSSR